MPTGTIRYHVEVGGSSLPAEPVSLTGDHVNNYDITLPAGKAGALTTRTDDGEGVITLLAGHGIADGDIVDIYWEGGARYAVTVDTGAATTLTFDDTPAATGDVLPADETAVVVCERITVNTVIDGDAVHLFGISCDQRSQITFYNAVDEIIKQVKIETANSGIAWHEDSGETNPLTGDPITVAKASNGSTTAATLRIRCLDDATP